MLLWRVMLVFYDPSISPVGGRKRPVPYFPPVVCVWQGWEKIALRSHAFLGVCGPVVRWSTNLPQLLCRVLRSRFVLSQVCQTVFLRMNTLFLFPPHCQPSSWPHFVWGFLFGFSRDYFGSQEKWTLFLSPSIRFLSPSIQILLKTIWATVFG